MERLLDSAWFQSLPGIGFAAALVSIVIMDGTGMQFMGMACSVKNTAINGLSYGAREGAAQNSFCCAR